MDEEEFGTALAKRLREALPGMQVSERTAVYQQGGPVAGQVTFNVDYSPSGAGLNRIIAVTVDIDVWDRGPDSSRAEDTASAIEEALIGWSVNTDRQGTVRLTYFSRAYMTEEVEKLAHITMRLTGRAFRRL